jgi:Uma2 family endonuclease
VREYNEFSLMETKAAISVEEYLRTSYEYDPEYVDGELVERSLPTYLHARAHAKICGAFIREETHCHLLVAIEVRIPTSGQRWRIPDLAILADRGPDSKYLSAPPLAVIEILSPEDSFASLLSKFEEYRDFGVAHSWLVDPERRHVYKYENGSLLQVDAIEFPGRGFRLAASEIFG